MGKVNDYGCVIAKLRARIGIMRDSSTIDNMIKAPSLSESINALSGSRRENLVDVYAKTGDLQQVELKLFEEEIETYKKIRKMLPVKAAGFISVLMEKLEIENLKNALRLWYSEVVRRHSIRYRASYLYSDEIVYPVNWDGIINAPNYEAVLKSLDSTPYIDVLSKFSYETISSKGLFDLEIALDQYYFKMLFSSISKLNKTDREIAQKLYTVDVDLKNILLLVRYCYYHDMDRSELDAIIIPFGGIYSEFIKAESAKSDDFIGYMRRVVAHKYPEIREEIDDIRRADDELTVRGENAKHILLIENYLGRMRRKEYAQMLVGENFSIGIVLAYFFLENHEDAMIRAILSAKFYNWSEEKIREAIAQ